MCLKLEAMTTQLVKATQRQSAYFLSLSNKDMIFMAYRCKSIKKEIFIAFTRISGQQLFFQKFEIDYQLLKAIKQGSAYTDQPAFNDASRYEKRKLFLSQGFLTRPRLF